MNDGTFQRRKRRGKRVRVTVFFFGLFSFLLPSLCLYNVAARPENARKSVRGGVQQKDVDFQAMLLATPKERRIAVRLTATNKTCTGASERRRDARERGSFLHVRNTPSAFEKGCAFVLCGSLMPISVNVCTRPRAELSTEAEKKKQSAAGWTGDVHSSRWPVFLFSILAVFAFSCGIVRAACVRLPIPVYAFSQSCVRISNKYHVAGVRSSHKTARSSLFRCCERTSDRPITIDAAFFPVFQMSLTFSSPLGRSEQRCEREQLTLSRFDSVSLSLSGFLCAHIRFKKLRRVANATLIFVGVAKSVGGS